jgi:hypothetical protein
MKMMTKVLITIISILTFGIVDYGEIVPADYMFFEDGMYGHEYDLSEFDLTDWYVYVGDYELLIYTPDDGNITDFDASTYMDGSNLVIQLETPYAARLDISENGNVYDDYFWLDLDYHDYDTKLHFVKLEVVETNYLTTTDLIVTLLFVPIWYFGIIFVRKGVMGA